MNLAEFRAAVQAQKPATTLQNQNLRGAQIRPNRYARGQNGDPTPPEHPGLGRIRPGKAVHTWNSMVPLTEPNRQTRPGKKLLPWQEGHGCGRIFDIHITQNPTMIDDITDTRWHFQPVKKG
jgi:hypothetical protein